MKCIEKRVQELVETYELEHNTKLTERELDLLRFGFEQAIMDIAYDEHKRRM